jgi:glycosyltransferase involved in cell wall biosynthesis
VFEYLRIWIKRYPRLAHAARVCKALGKESCALFVMPFRLVYLIWTYLWIGRTGHQIPKHSSATETPLIVMLVWSHLPTDPRVEREARALASHGYRVKILCPQWFQPAPVPDWGAGVEIKYLNHSAANGMLRFPWLMSRKLLSAALREPAWAYHAHDLNTVLPALAAAAQKRALCVCDFHEWYSENATFIESRQVYLPHSALKKWLFKKVEHLCLEYASKVVTVCESIANELEASHPGASSVGVIRNIPPLDAKAVVAPTIDIRKELGIAEDKAIVLYQGGLGPSRGLDSLIVAMREVHNAVLVIRGPNLHAYSDYYLELADRHEVKYKVYLLPAVSSHRCVAEAAAADIGIWTLMPICKNFTYALPNKVFEYLAAGLPVACAHHAEVAKIVKEFDVGRCFDPESPASIAKAIEELASSCETRQRCKNNVGSALASLKADSEWAKLAAMYDELGKRNTKVSFESERCAA